MSSKLISLLKTHTAVSESFLDTFYTNFQVGDDLKFHINENDICSYLHISNTTLRRRVQNYYSKDELFFENVDYIKKRSSTTTTKITYFLNYKAFQRLAMTGTSKESEEVRAYFTLIEEFLRENASLINQAVEANLEDTHKYKDLEVAYFFAVNPDNTDDLFKVGTTKDILVILNECGRLIDKGSEGYNSDDCDEDDVFV